MRRSERRPNRVYTAAVVGSSPAGPTHVTWFCCHLVLSGVAVVVHPVRGGEQRPSDRSRMHRRQELLMLGRKPHADVASLVLHGSHIGGETILASHRWPVWSEVSDRFGFP